MLDLPRLCFILLSKVHVYLFIYICGRCYISKRNSMDTILGYLLDNWPYAVWIVVGGAIVWLYFLTKVKADKSEEKATDALVRIDRLPCETHKIILDAQKDGNRDRDIKIEKISIGMEYINKNISDISKNITAIAGKMNVGIISATPFTQSLSPLAITESGKEKVRELGIDKMIDSNWEKISNLITDSIESKNPYDIQQFILDETAVFPEKFINPKDMDRIKTDAYNIGEILQSYMRVIAVLVRDKYFKEHSIKLSDIDKHDPNR
jgi:hypothetical protein